MSAFDNEYRALIIIVTTGIIMGGFTWMSSIKHATDLSMAAVSAGLEQRVVKVPNRDAFAIWVKPGTKPEDLLLEKP